MTLKFVNFIARWYERGGMGVERPPGNHTGNGSYRAPTYLRLVPDPGQSGWWQH